VADFECVTRSNYFRVKNADLFREFMSHATGSGTIELWEEKDKQGRQVFAFGLYGHITGYSLTSTVEDDEGIDEEYDFDAFLQRLQEHVVDDDAIIIMIAGHESLRYVVGSAIIVTSGEIVFLDATHEAKLYAAKRLGNPKWTTKCDY